MLLSVTQGPGQSPDHGRELAPGDAASLPFDGNLSRYLDTLPHGHRTHLVKQDEPFQRWQLYLYQQSALVYAALSEDERRYYYPKHVGEYEWKLALAALPLLPVFPDPDLALHAPQDAPRADVGQGMGVYPMIQAALNRAGVSAPAAFLYWIAQDRARPPEKRDKFTVGELRDSLAQRGIHWSARRIRDTLSDGLRGPVRLWRVTGRDRRDRRQTVYAIRAKEKVMADALEWLGEADDPDHPPDCGIRAALPNRAWQDTPRTWLAFVWAAFVEDHRGNGHWARATMAEQFGFSRRGSRYLDLATDLRSTSQVAAAPLTGMNEDQRAEVEDRRREYHWYHAQAWRHEGRRYRRTWICWQDVNTYRSISTQSTSHRRRHLNTEVHRIVAENVRISCVDAPQGVDGSAPHEATRRFETDQRAQRYRRQHPDQPTLTLLQRFGPAVRAHNVFRFDPSDVATLGEVSRE
jgi:hypothetical protein